MKQERSKQWTLGTSRGDMFAENVVNLGQGRTTFVGTAQTVLTTSSLIPTSVTSVQSAIEIVLIEANCAGSTSRVPSMTQMNRLHEVEVACVEEIRNEEAKTHLRKRSRLLNKYLVVVSQLVADKTMKMIETMTIKIMMEAIARDPETVVHVPPTCIPSLGPVAVAGHEKAQVALDEAYHSPPQ